jgi:ferredoxin
MADTLSFTGACEGSVSCSTCHVILSPEHYDKLEEADDEENDMLGMSCLSYLVGSVFLFLSLFSYQL